MQMNIIIESEGEYNKWLAEQDEFVAQMPELFRGFEEISGEKIRINSKKQIKKYVN